MSKVFFTIFGKGFVGTSLSTYLKKNNHKVFSPKKKKFKFNKNLGHVVYCIGNQNWLENLEKTFEANVSMVAKIIFNNKFESFTLISSTRLYFANKEGRTKENDFIKVNTNRNDFLYNSLKITSENLCLSLVNKKIKVVRISNLYGENFTNQSYILPTWIRDSVKKKRINLYINKNSTKDFIHVDDAFEVLLKVILKGKYRLYNIATGKNIKLSKILEKIKKISNCKIHSKSKLKIVKEPKINIDRIKKEFGFRAKRNLIELINKFIYKYKKSFK